MRAFEDMLTFSGRTGRAVVIETDRPWRYIFWEHAQYVGTVDLGGDVWFTPEWCETNSPNDLHCYEPIMDKRLQWSRIAVLEAGPARVRVRWTYALPDMRYRNFHGNSRAEEIYTVYPDGLALREVALWPGDATNHGGNANLWQMAEWILIQGSGVHPVDVLEMPTPFELTDGRGRRVAVPWPLPAPDFEPLCRHYPEVAEFPLYIGRIRVHGRPHPFLGFARNQALFPFAPCNACHRGHPYFGLFPGEHLYNIYQHWPVTDREDFIEWVPAGDAMGRVATHTSFVDVNFAMRRSADDYIPTPAPATTWYMLTGAVDPALDQARLEELVRSTFEPGAVEIVRDPGEPDVLHRGRVLFEGYDFGLRAYVIRKQGRDRVRFRLRPGEVQWHPAFVVTGWESAGAVVQVDGAEPAAGSVAVQWNRARSELVVWLEGRFSAPCEVEITGGQEGKGLP